MNIIEINNNFEEILNDNSKVLVDFNANWCGPCKMIKPILEEIATENNNIKIVSVNVDNNEELAKKYEIMSIPCLILFENKTEKNRLIGLRSKSDIIKFIGEK